jgi:hypothetical protein
MTVIVTVRASAGFTKFHITCASEDSKSEKLTPNRDVPSQPNLRITVNDKVIDSDSAWQTWRQTQKATNLRLQGPGQQARA